MSNKSKAKSRRKNYLKRKNVLKNNLPKAVGYDHIVYKPKVGNVQEFFGIK